MGDGVKHIGVDAGTCLRVVLVERVLNRHHDVAIPLGPAISLIGLCGTAGGDVFHRAEFDDLVFGIEHRSQRDPDRNMNRIGAGDDGARGIQNRHDRPVVLADEIREDQIHFIFKSEDQAQDAKRRTPVVHDPKRIDQRFLAIRDKIGFAETLHVSGFGLDRLPHDRIVADGDRRRVVEPRHDAAARIEQDDVGIDRIFANVLAEPGPQGRKRAVVIAGIAAIAQEGADVLVAGEKSDIGGPLKQVPDENIDRDLRLRACVLQTFLERFRSQLVQQIGGEVAEGATRIADIDSGARHLAEQAQIIPNRLQLLQEAAVFLRHRHMRNDPLQPGIQIDSLEAVCHGMIWKRGRARPAMNDFIFRFYKSVCLPNGFCL